MCAQVWLLTDRLIREDYPQVQILRALRQRCSEQDVRFRAVFLDQIAVTVVGGHLGERCPGGAGGEGGAGGVHGSGEPTALRIKPLSMVALLCIKLRPTVEKMLNSLRRRVSGEIHIHLKLKAPNLKL